VIDWVGAFGKRLSPDLEAGLSMIWRADVVEASSARLAFSDGSAAAVDRSVPRFVETDAYTGSFSRQWEIFRETQIDSVQGTSLAEQDIRAKTGLTPEDVRGRLVLDAGVGAGRVAEVLAGWGAHVVGVDLSRSVESARDNLAGSPDAVVVQGDLMDPPFRPGVFDLVVSLGVLHHTPSTRDALASIAGLVKPGGRIAVWVYSEAYARRKEWIPTTSRIPLEAFFDWCTWTVGTLRDGGRPALLESARPAMPFSLHHPTADRSVLALFDGYTPTYHGVHTNAELACWLAEFGFADVRNHRVPASASARRPD